MRKMILILLLSMSSLYFCSCSTNKESSGEVETITTLNETNSIMDFSEDEAVDLLRNILQQDELKYQVQGEEKYIGQDSYSIKAFYDEGDHITVKGFYLVLKESHEVYEQNLLGEGYIKIS